MITDRQETQVETMTTAQAAAYWGITEPSARRRLADHPEVQPLPSTGRANLYDADQIRAVEVRRGRRTDLAELVDLLHAAGITYRMTRPDGGGVRVEIDGQLLTYTAARAYLATHPRVLALGDTPPAVTHHGVAEDEHGAPRRVLVGALQVIDTGELTPRSRQPLLGWRLTGPYREHVTADVNARDVTAATAWATRTFSVIGHAVTGWQHHRDDIGEWWEPIPPFTSPRDHVNGGGVNGHVTDAGDVTAELAARAFTIANLPGDVTVYHAPDGRVTASTHWAGQTLIQVVVRNLTEPAADAVRIRAGRPPLDRAREALASALDALGYPRPGGPAS